MLGMVLHAGKQSRGQQASTVHRPHPRRAPETQVAHVLLAIVRVAPRAEGQQDVANILRICMRVHRLRLGQTGLSMRRPLPRGLCFGATPAAGWVCSELAGRDWLAGLNKCAGSPSGRTWAGRYGGLHLLGSLLEAGSEGTVGRMHVDAGPPQEALLQQLCPDLPQELQVLRRTC